MSAQQSVPLRLPAESDEPAVWRVQSLAPYAIVGVLVLAFGVGFAWLSVLRHEAYQSHAFDLANVDQAAWNTLHGHILRFTDMAVGQRVLTTRLAIHVEPLLAALSPLYLLWNGPETLLVVQSLVVATGAIPAYLIGRRFVGSPWLALAFPLAYLLHPSLQNAVLDDFHAVTMSASFLLWALFFALRSSLIGFWLTSLLAMATKEEVGLLVAMIGLIWVARGRWRVASLAVIVGLAWFAVAVDVVIPANNRLGHSPYLSRYSYLGHGLGGILLAPFRHPAAVAHVATSPSRLAYLNDVLAPVAFLSVVGLPLLALALPALAVNMLSADPRMYSGFYQYSAEVVPFVVVAAALGVGLAARAVAAFRQDLRLPVAAVLCTAVVAAAGYESYRYGFSPLAEGYVIPEAGAHQAGESQILSRIPPSAVVAAADEVAPHVSRRYWLYLLPTTRPLNGPAAQYIVLDASIPSLPVSPRTLHAVAVRALRHGYGIVAVRDGVLLLRRADRRKQLPPAFYSFMFGTSRPAQKEGLRWGPLELAGVTIHPRNAMVNRARPAVEVETYWRLSKRLPRGTRISVLLSPVYGSIHPKISGRWQRATDSPTWDWLPFRRWPRGPTVHAALVPLVPDTSAGGNVDVAIQVDGLGPVRDLKSGQRVLGARTTARLATIRVGP